MKVDVNMVGSRGWEYCKGDRGEGGKDWRGRRGRLDAETSAKFAAFFL